MEGKARLPDLFAASLGNVAVNALSRTQVVAINRSVSVAHFPVLDNNLRSGRHIHFQPDHADHVLPQVKHVGAGLRLADRFRGKRFNLADRVAGMGFDYFRRRLHAVDQNHILPVGQVKPRLVPAGRLLARIIGLAFKQVSLQQWAVFPDPGRIGNQPFATAVRQLHFQHTGKPGIPAIISLMVVEAPIPGKPSLPQQCGQGVGPQRQRIGYIERMRVHALVIVRITGQQLHVPDLLAVQPGFANPERRNVQRSGSHLLIEAKIPPQHWTGPCRPSAPNPFSIPLHKVVPCVRVLFLTQHARSGCNDCDKPSNYCDTLPFLLKASDCTLSQIAAGCSFVDSRYFGRIFRGAMGMPPSKYRARMSDPLV